MSKSSYSAIDSDLSASTMGVSLTALVYTLLSLLVLVSGNVWAKGAVTSVTTAEIDATATSYTVGGETYQWGLGKNLVVEGFDLGPENFTHRRQADSVILLRVDNPQISGAPCAMFAEISGAARTYEATFPDNGSGSCDMEEILRNRIVNRGTLDLFSNTGVTLNTIERADFIFNPGIKAPDTAAELDASGHVVSEKSGNNPVKMAAILALDGSGTPSQYGPLVTVLAKGCADPDICYGVTDIAFEDDFLYSATGNPEFVQLTNETLGMAFVTLADLGVALDQVYFGFSYFAADVTTEDLTKPETFPQGTTGDPGDADLYGGSDGYFRIGPVVAPVATNDKATTASNTAVTIAVLDNDRPLGTLTPSILTQPANGVVVLNADNTLTYTPTLNTSGEDTFTYRVTDGGGATADAEVTVTVTAVAEDDSDKDGIPDRTDLDDDNDGILDTVEGEGDFDGDSIINRLDLDADGDGILDLEESGLTEAQQQALDSNSDGQIDASQPFGANGIADNIETAAESGSVNYSGNGAAELPVDTDGDSHFDFLDLDTDNDGLSDVIEAGFADPEDDGHAAAGEATMNPLSTDNDGIADYRDLDSDNDGLTDLIEAGGIDAGFDGLVDAFIDADNDGRDDSYDSSQGGFKLPYYDSDRDGLPDYRDLDSDNDGLKDIVEAGLPDRNNDGLVDDFSDADGNGYDERVAAVLGATGVLPDDNGNGIPDYREPPAEIETGLNGHGGGSLGGGFLLLLGGLLRYRKLTQRDPGKRA